MAALGYAKTKKTQVSTCRGEERSLPLPNPSSCVMAGSDDSYSVFTQTARKRQRIPVLAVRSYFQRHQHSHSPPASHTASLVTRGCFARRNVVSCVLLALFWEPDSGSSGTLQCQAVNSWQEMVPAACPGREDACAPVKAALVSGLGREADPRF